MSYDENDSDDNNTKKKLSAADQIAIHLVEVKEMICFLDYSFERAFTMKEKSFIRAYKEHVLLIQ